MPQPGADASFARRRKALLAGGVVLGTGVAATLAAWSDDTWVSASFNTKSPVIESSVDRQTWQANTPSAPGTVTFDPAISLAPGQIKYVPVYLRTSSSTDQAATLAVSEARQSADPASDGGLWSAVTYGARAIQTTTLNPPACDESLFTYQVTDILNILGPLVPNPLINSSARLFGKQGTISENQDSRVPLSTAAPSATFTLSANSGNTYLVCYRFELPSSAATVTPSLNGKSIYPYWTFTGEFS